MNKASGFCFRLEYHFPCYIEFRLAPHIELREPQAADKLWPLELFRASEGAIDSVGKYLHNLQSLGNPAEAHLLTNYDVVLLLKEVHQAAYRVDLAQFDPIASIPLLRRPVKDVTDAHNALKRANDFC